MTGRCASVKDYIIELIEYRGMYLQYYNKIIVDILKGCKITKVIAKELEKLFDIHYKLFLNIDSMHKIEQRYLKRKAMQRITKKALT